MVKKKSEPGTRYMVRPLPLPFPLDREGEQEGGVWWGEIEKNKGCPGRGTLYYCC